MRRAAARLAAALVLALVAWTAGAAASSPAAEAAGGAAFGPVARRAAGLAPATTATTATDPNALSSPPTQTKPPVGHVRSAREVIAAARRVPKVRAILPHHPGWRAEAFLKGAYDWQVSFYSRDGKEVAQVLIDDHSGTVLEAWTGFQVAWSMARGYPGAFGRKVNALYVWIPLCVLFVLPFFDRRRIFRALHLDLLVLLGFSISLAFFNHGEIGLSVPLAYPFLGYLLVRMLMLGWRRGPGARTRPTQPLRLLVPRSWLVAGVVFLLGFHVGLNVVNSNVIDVGYAGVIGANHLRTGKPLYGHFPKDNQHGDTYGPVNYYAYVPAELAFHWGGAWDDLPAAHAAAIAFDLLTALGLFLLGRRVRGPTLGVALAYAWAAFPFTIYASSSNSNDSLVALLIVAALLVVSSAPARGAAVALAGLTKFAPLGLAPLLLRTPDGVPRRRPRSGRRSALGYVVGFAVAAAVIMLPVLLGGHLRTFYDQTLGFQNGRGSPFSIWGLYGWGTAQTVVKVAGVVLALAVAVVPRRRDLFQVAALGAAVIIALQLGITHWFYLYIPWFLPLVMLALLGRFPEPASRTVVASATAAPRRPATVAVPVG